MFNSDPEEFVTNEPEVKKQKLDESCGSKPLHSSLKYNSIRAPPLVQYNSVYSYCETSKSKSALLPDSEKPLVAGLHSVQSISSPIVLKTPAVQRTAPVGERPYTFYTIEELSLVKCLKNWANTKVCPVGLVTYDYDLQLCCLDSVLESGQCRLMMDTSLLVEIPKLDNIMQVFGTLYICGGKPMLQVNFCRDLSSVNLPLFVESYKLMQKYVPKYLCLPENKDFIEDKEMEVHSFENKIELNDTLDNCDLSSLP